MENHHAHKITDQQLAEPTVDMGVVVHRQRMGPEESMELLGAEQSLP